MNDHKSDDKESVCFTHSLFKIRVFKKETSVNTERMGKRGDEIMKLLGRKIKKQAIAIFMAALMVLGSITLLPPAEYDTAGKRRMGVPFFRTGRYDVYSGPGKVL